MINLGAIQYLPSLRTALTPFGPEYHLENYFRVKNRTSLVDIRIGDETFYNNWWGLGLIVQNIYSNNKLSLDINLDTWKQPKLGLGSHFKSTNNNTMGAAFSVRGFYKITHTQYPVSIVTELGYKSAGFLQGYNLNASTIFLIGISI
jgi:hypothetical protein